jgi:TolA-binding protein
MLRIAPALVLLLGCFTLSCHKRPSKAPPPGAKTQPAPAIPSDFELAEARYAAGDFSAAASFYEEYLRSNPGKNQDLALYHLGLAYALQGATTENLEKSQSILQQFVEQYPGAARLTEATLLLSLQTEIKKLSAAAVQKQTELDSTKTKQRAEIDKLKDEIKEQQARIKTLAEELQRLRDIDMERRPSRPSR